MERIKRTISFVFLIAALGVQAQHASLKRAEQSFERMAYEDAASHFEKAVKQGANEMEVARRLAISYRKLRDLKNAEKWYGKMILGKAVQPEDLYDFSEVLRSNAKYAESEFWLEEYRELVGSDSRIARQQNSLAYLEDIWFEPVLDCRIKNINLNTTMSEMTPTLHQGKMYFSASRNSSALVERTHSWDDQPFLDFYVGDTSLYGEIENIVELNGSFNTKWHESNICFSPDGERIYFTRNNFFKGKTRTNEKGINNLKIYYCDAKENGSWGDEKQFQYNSDDYSVGHPSISEDGKRLFFTSNMPGGLGKTDIWMCELNDQGEWGQPVNLGPNVNTEGVEMFPNSYGDGTLYFSSDGHKGLGGLDIHAVRMPYNRPGEVENLGSPVNTGSDDFALILNEKGTRGYFTSNRPGSVGADDIYTFILDDPMRFDMTLNGRVTLGFQGPRQSGMEVRLLDKDGALIHAVVSDDQGNFEFQIDKGMDYSLVTGGPGEEIMLAFDTHEITETPFNLEMDLVIPSLTGVTLYAQIKDMRTGRPLRDVDVRLTSKSGEELFRGSTDDSGDTRKSFPEAKIDEELTYIIELDKPGYLPRSFEINLKVDEFREIPLHEELGDMFYLVPSNVGVDLGEAMALKPIYFAHNSAKILPQAQEELDRVLEVLEAFPLMVVECGSHTSSLGSASYNKSLSKRRAESTRKYLISKGIDSKRLRAKGYGESVLVNECEDGVECSEERHAFNRRTEFVILDM